MTLFSDVLHGSDAGIRVTRLGDRCVCVGNLGPSDVAIILHRVLTLSPDQALPQLRLVSERVTRRGCRNLVTLYRPTLVCGPRRVTFYCFVNLTRCRLGSAVTTLTSFHLNIDHIGSSDSSRVIDSLCYLVNSVRRRLKRRHRTCTTCSDYLI